MPAPLAVLALVPALFAPVSGWSTGHAAVHACPGVPAARCVQAESWAATVPWRGRGAGLPHEVLTVLPPGGVALQVIVSRERGSRPARGLAWTPTIGRRQIGGLEGVPSTIGVWQRSIVLGRRRATVFAYFGRVHPTAAQLQRAVGELATLR